MTKRNNNRFGLRFEDMSEQDRAYYSAFFQDPAPAEGEPGYTVPAHRAVAARVRMYFGLSFTLFVVGLLCTLVPLFTGHLLLAGAGLLVVLVGLFLLIAVRRRRFASLRVPGQAPVAKNKKAKWFWFPHSLVLLGVASAIIAIAVVPYLFAPEDENLMRSHVAMWTEITLLLWLMAALFYGIFALAVYTPEDHDESIIRPTDYAERQLEKDLSRGIKRGDDDFYDSSWISGR